MGNAEDCRSGEYRMAERRATMVDRRKVTLRVRSGLTQALHWLPEDRSPERAARATRSGERVKNRSLLRTARPAILPAAPGLEQAS